MEEPVRKKMRKGTKSCIECTCHMRTATNGNCVTAEYPLIDSSILDCMMAVWSILELPNVVHFHNVVMWYHSTIQGTSLWLGHLECCPVPLLRYFVPIVEPKGSNVL